MAEAVVAINSTFISAILVSSIPTLPAQTFGVIFGFLRVGGI